MPEPKFFDEDTSAWVHGPAIADITDTADASYSANEQTMLGNLKASLNSVLAALRSAGIIAQD
jgi:uncharacterized phage-associated protein